MIGRWVVFPRRIFVFAAVESVNAWSPPRGFRVAIGGRPPRKPPFLPRRILTRKLDPTAPRPPPQHAERTGEQKPNVVRRRNPLRRCADMEECWPALPSTLASSTDAKASRLRNKFPKAAVEAFAIGILPRAARLDVEPLEPAEEEERNREAGGWPWRRRGLRHRAARF